MIVCLRRLIARPVCRSPDSAPNVNLISRLIRWRRRREGVKLMLSLPDHLLEDIGLSRVEIEEASRGRHDVFCRPAQIPLAPEERRGTTETIAGAARGANFAV